MIAMMAEQWAAAPEQVIYPDETMTPEPSLSGEELAASIAHGRELFFGKAECKKCHGPTALGDGQTDDYNEWNKFNKQFVENTQALVERIESLEEDLKQEQGEAREQLDLEIEDANKWLALRQAIEPTLFPVRNIQPRNLRQGVYRGGRRPVDLFWRVKAGIPGTPMPAAPPSLTEKDIWDIVAYVRSLPYEPASNPQRALHINARALP